MSQKYTYYSETERVFQKILKFVLCVKFADEMIPL